MSSKLQITLVLITKIAEIIKNANDMIKTLGYEQEIPPTITEEDRLIAREFADSISFDEQSRGMLFEGYIIIDNNEIKHYLVPISHGMSPLDAVLRNRLVVDNKDGYIPEAVHKAISKRYQNIARSIEQGKLEYKVTWWADFEDPDFPLTKVDGNNLRNKVEGIILAHKSMVLNAKYSSGIEYLHNQYKVWKSLLDLSNKYILDSERRDVLNDLTEKNRELTKALANYMETLSSKSDALNIIEGILFVASLLSGSANSSSGDNDSEGLHFAKNEIKNDYNITVKVIKELEEQFQDNYLKLKQEYEIKIKHKGSLPLLKEIEIKKLP